MDKPNNGDSPTNDALPVRRRGRPPGSKNRRVDHGQQNNGLEVVKFTAEQEAEYKSLLADAKKDLDTIQHSILQFSLTIKKIQQSRLYLIGKYTTFAEFFQQEFGFGRHQAYHYIHAADILSNLLRLGFPESELPTKERVCRALDTLEPDQIAKVWKLVLKQAQASGAEPTSKDVEAAAGALGVGSDIQGSEGEEDNSEEELEAQQRQQDSEALIKEWETVAKKLRVGLDRETLTKSTILRLAAVLTDINHRSMMLLAALKKAQEPATAEPAQEAEVIS